MSLFCQVDANLPDNLAQKIVEAVKRHLPSSRYRVFLFGSRALGSADARSDFDIGIEATEQIPLDVMSEIKEELEALPVLQKFDVVDFSRSDPGLRSIAMKTTRLLDER